MKWTGPRFAILLAIALTVWLWPSIFGGKVLVPLDIMAHNPPHEATGTVHNPLIGDMLYETYAWHLFQRRALSGGELPLWNPDTFCGHPLYTGGQASTFYPLGVIFLVLPLPRAFVVFLWVHMFLAGLFTWMLCRRIGLGGFGAAIGGLTVGMSGFLALHFVFPMLLASAIWLPLILVWMDALAASCTQDIAAPGAPAVRSVPPLPTAGSGGSRNETVAPTPRRTRVWLLLAGPPLLTLPALGGFFEIAFYAAVAAALFALLLIGRMLYAGQTRAASAFTWRLALSGGLALMLAAPQLLPFFEVMNRNVRAGRADYEHAVAGAIKPYELLTLIAPDIVGNPAVHQTLDLRQREWRPIHARTGSDFYYYGPKNYVEVGFYFGLVPLGFALLSVARRHRYRAYFLIVVAVAIAFAFGTPVYRLFYHFVPGAEQVRTPFRWIYLAAICGAGLAAMGAQHWYERLGAPSHIVSRTLSIILVVIAAVLAAALAAMFFFPAPVERVARALLEASPRISATFRNSAELAGPLWLNAARFAVLALLTCVIIGLAYWRAWSPRAATALSLAAFVLVAFDLGQATYAFNTQADPAILKTTPPVISYLQKDPGVFRIGRYGPDKVMYPNTPTLYGLQDYGGYDSIITRQYAAFMQAIETQHLLPYNIVTNFVRPQSLDSPLLPLLNIRYLLTNRQLRHRDWERVPVAGNLNLYRVRKDRELPRAFLVNEAVPAGSLEDAIARIAGRQVDVFKAAIVETDAAAASKLVEPGGDAGVAEIRDYRMSSVTVSTESDRRRLLVLCDVMYPGWHAYVDGLRAPVHVTDGIFRGVSVPAGRHLVEFRFEPASFRIGMVLAAAAILALLIMLLAGLRGPGECILPPAATAQ